MTVPRRILVLYNQPLLPENHPEAESEQEVIYVVEHVTRALTEAGFQVSTAGVGLDAEDLIRQVRRHQPDAVFNLFEGIPGKIDSEATAAGLLEWLGVAYTGSGPRALTLARDKPVTRLMLHAAGLPTPEGLAVERPDEPPLQDGGLHSILAGRPLRWPLIVKPACQDGSVGIDQGSVVTTAEALRRRVAVVHEQFGPPVLIEEYIAGRELTVGVIEVPERLALPPAEFEFRPQPGHWPIVTYDTKWREDSPDAHRASYREVADVPAELSRHLSELAVKAFGVLGLRDYGRIDFRVTEAGEPFILEANPNPDLNPIAGLAGVLQAVGLTYDDFLIRLAERALSRK